MVHDDDWIRLIEELRLGGPLNDAVIVEMENSLATYSFQAQDASSGPAAKLYEVLLSGLCPLEELELFCRGRPFDIRGLEGKLQDQRARILNSAPKAFIAQPFRESTNDHYEKVIRPSCYWELVNPIRIDKESVESNLIAKIEKGLREADFFIANLTDNNPNVFYEIGHFEGRGINGLFLCMEPNEKMFYAGAKDIVEIKRGPDGVADSRRRLREGLRKIKMKFLT